MFHYIREAKSLLSSCILWREVEIENGGTNWRASFNKPVHFLIGVIKPFLLQLYLKFSGCEPA